MDSVFGQLTARTGKSATGRANGNSAGPMSDCRVGSTGGKSVGNK